MGNILNYISENILSHYGPVVLGGAVFFVVAWLFAILVDKALSHFMIRRLGLDSGYVTLMAKTVRYAILVLAGIAVLQDLGVEIASLIAAMGIFGFALAIGLRTTSTNFFTGVMLFILKPYTVGEHIKGERVEGIVESMSFFHTVVVTKDGVFVAVPNAAMWARSVENHSRERPLNVELDISIEPGKPFDELRMLVAQALLSVDMVLTDNAPLIRVVDVKSQSMKIRAGFWCAAEHEWTARDRASAAIRLALTDAGVAIKRIGPAKKSTARKRLERPEPAGPADDLG